MLNANRIQHFLLLILRRRKGEVYVYARTVAGLYVDEYKFAFGYFYGNNVLVKGACAQLQDCIAVVRRQGQRAICRCFVSIASLVGNRAFAVKGSDGL